MVNISFSQLSNIGRRKVNEDSIGVYKGPKAHAFILCDGLGGHGMGDKASSLVRDVFINQFQNMQDCSNILPSTFMAAQDILMCEQIRQKAQSKMKTTAVALVVDEDKAYIGHVGDSRLYIFRNNKVMKRTLDHSIPQMLVASKEIKESDIRNHPDRSMLVKVMGIEWEKPLFELMKPIPLRKCQAFLLCSDGFWELINEDEMCKCLEKAVNVDHWLQMMNDIVQSNGINVNMDNNSAIAVWCKRD